VLASLEQASPNDILPNRGNAEQIVATVISHRWHRPW